MLSRISQFKQSLSDEFEQAVSPQRPLNDPVSIIERNAEILRAETPDANDIMMESEEEVVNAARYPDSSESTEKDKHIAADQDTGHNAELQDPPHSQKTINEASPRERSKSPQVGADPVTYDTESRPKTTKSTRGGAERDTRARSNGASGRRASHASDVSSTAADGANGRDLDGNDNKAGISSDKKGGDGSENKMKSDANEKAQDTPPATAEAESGPVQPQLPSSASKPETQEESRVGSGTPAPQDAVSGGPAELVEPQNHKPIESQRPVSVDIPSGTATPPRGAALDTSDPVLAAKLAKFEKYEQKYPGLLKAYKTEKKKNDLVRVYEKILSEHTPCTSIAEPQELVSYLTGLSSRSELQQKEIGKLNSDMAKLKADLSSERRKNTDLKQDLERTRQRSEQQIAEARAQTEAQAGAQANLEELAHLKEKVSTLEQQLAESEAAASVAARTQTTLRTQLDELGLRLAENQTELEVVRDELGDSERRAQERLQELSSVRQALRSRDKDRRRSIDEASAQIAALTADKEQLEAEVELLGRRIIRETEQLHVQLRSLRSQLRESESHASDLQQELDQHLSRHESASPSRAPSIKSVEPSEKDDRAEVAQAQAEAAASGAVKANELLKQVNADNALRIEKLQKAQRALTADLEQLRSENQQLRRRSSTNSADSGAFDSEKQKAYLRNVLLGFIEHRDQRKMLLPVLATLLGFQDGEEEKILNYLK